MEFYEYPASQRVHCNYKEPSPPEPFLGLPPEFWDSIYGKTLKTVMRLLRNSSAFGLVISLGIFLIDSLYHALFGEDAFLYLNIIIVGSICYIIIWIISWISYWGYNYFIPIHGPIKIKENEDLATYRNQETTDRIVEKHEKLITVLKDYNTSIDQVNQTVAEHPCPVEKVNPEDLKPKPKSQQPKVVQIVDPVEDAKIIEKYDYFARIRRQYLETCTKAQDKLNGEDVEVPQFGNPYSKSRKVWPKMKHYVETWECGDPWNPACPTPSPSNTLINAANISPEPKENDAEAGEDVKTE